MKLPALEALALTLACAQAQAQPRVSGGDATLYFAGRPNRILVIDEATEKVSGEIALKTGLPIGLALSQDRRRFYARMWNLEGIEVVDIERRQSIDAFRLSEDNKKVRILAAEADPAHRFMVLLTRTATKLVDRFEIGPPTIVQYDLAAKKVVRTIPWPKGEEREGMQILFSPDGRLLYFFSDDVLIYDTAEFKQVDKWELSRPLEDGLGRIDFASADVVNEEPGFFSGIFTAEDPVQKRRLMGVARVDLAAKALDFFTVGPATSLSFALAPGRKRAYGLHQEIGKYEFWAFDLEKRRLIGKTEVPGRPRMSIKVSSNGKLLYVHRAGNTIDVHDAQSYRRLRTLSFDAEMTSELFVLPKRPAAAAAAPGR